LIIPKDASIIKEYLEEFSASKKIPPSLLGLDISWEYFDTRYGSAIKWIEEKNHAVISNGPFYLENYSPEARTITIKSFEDVTYPFTAGKWSEFENVSMPKITKITVPDQIVQGQRIEIPIHAVDASKLYYFVNDASGMQVDSGILEIQDDHTTIVFLEDLTNKMTIGGNDLKLYAISDSVLKPDIYTTSFIVIDSEPGELLEAREVSEMAIDKKTDHIGTISLVMGVIIIGIIIYIRRARKTKQQTH
jgi:peptide/nickel transport system substrate-binding protein